MPWIYNSPRAASRLVSEQVNTTQARLTKLVLDLPTDEALAEDASAYLEIAGGLIVNGKFEKVEFSVCTFTGTAVWNAFVSGFDEQKVLTFLRNNGKLPAGVYQP